MSTIDNEVAEVVDHLGNVVTKSELSGFMNIFGEPEFRYEYVLWDGQPSDLAYSALALLNLILLIRSNSELLAKDIV